MLFKRFRIAGGITEIKPGTIQGENEIGEMEYEFFDSALVLLTIHRVLGNNYIYYQWGYLASAPVFFRSFCFLCPPLKSHQEQTLSAITSL